MDEMAEAVKKANTRWEQDDQIKETRAEFIAQALKDAGYSKVEDAAQRMISGINESQERRIKELEDALQEIKARIESWGVRL